MWKVSSQGSEINAEITWENDTVKGMLCIEPADEYTILSAELTHGSEKLNVQIYVRDSADLPYLQACLKQCEWHGALSGNAYQA